MALQEKAGSANRIKGRGRLDGVLLLAHPCVYLRVVCHHRRSPGRRRWKKTETEGERTGFSCRIGHGDVANHAGKPDPFISLVCVRDP